MRSHPRHQTKKSILIIGMFDSIHFARWLSQFDNGDFEFTIFPSSKFKKVNPLLRQLLSQNYIQIPTHLRMMPVAFWGYLDYLIFEITRKASSIFRFRARFLQSTIASGDFQFIHILEMQNAGYLYLDVTRKINLDNSTKVICTNWGSDIYYFKNFSEHLVKIKRLLQISDYYSAECERDYVLAREFGFTGEFLPCIPNAGGFNLFDDFPKDFHQRNMIIGKAYGGEFGMGILLIDILDKFLNKFPNTPVYLYSVTDDVLPYAQNLQRKYSNVDFVEQRNKIPNKDLLKLFKTSRIYIGLSKSDGISTSFLEALVCGTYPIQTSTSCAEEWVLKGAKADIVNLDENEILEILVNTYFDLPKLSDAQISNFAISKEHLDKQKIKQISHLFYP